MPVYQWSQTAATNASADPTINWAEGQAPSSVNDSARAMMAAVAKWRDDNAGTLITGGTSSAYTLGTNQAFDSAAHANGMTICFFAHATNAANPTIVVDGIGPYSLVANGDNLIPAGVLIANSPYMATFNLSNNVWRLHNFYGNPYNRPIGGGMLYFGSTVPNSNFAFPNGAAISRSTYSALFGMVGTTYGAGDGSMTFNLPDLTGRVPAMKEAASTRLTPTYFTGNSTLLGSVGGGESNTILTANLPPYTPAGTITNGAITNTVTGGTNGSTGTSSAVSATGVQLLTGSTPIAVGASQAASTFAGTAQGGSSSPIRTVQPTIIINYIMRII